jgi:hypothetical protein
MLTQDVFSRDELYDIFPPTMKEFDKTSYVRQLTIGLSAFRRTSGGYFRKTTGVNEVLSEVLHEMIEKRTSKDFNEERTDW